MAIIQTVIQKHLGTVLPYISRKACLVRFIIEMNLRKQLSPESVDLVVVSFSSIYTHLYLSHVCVIARENWNVPPPPVGALSFIFLENYIHTLLASAYVLDSKRCLSSSKSLKGKVERKMKHSGIFRFLYVLKP